MFKISTHLFLVCLLLIDALEQGVKVSNKDGRTMPIASFSSVSIVNFEQVNAGLDVYLRFTIIHIERSQVHLFIWSVRSSTDDILKSSFTYLIQLLDRESIYDTGFTLYPLKTLERNRWVEMG